MMHGRAKRVLYGGRKPQMTPGNRADLKLYALHITETLEALSREKQHFVALFIFIALFTLYSLVSFIRATAQGDRWGWYLLWLLFGGWWLIFVIVEGTFAERYNGSRQYVKQCNIALLMVNLRFNPKIMALESLLVDKPLSL
jgi:hypothetical protein